MGSNKRYPGHRIDNEIDEVVIRAKPIGLSPAELNLEEHPPVAAQQPVPVRAWVRFTEAVIRPECEAIAWTDRAVQVRWITHGGETMTTWVWASAVERRK